MALSSRGNVCLGPFFYGDLMNFLLEVGKILFQGIMVAGSICALAPDVVFSDWRGPAAAFFLYGAIKSISKWQ